MDALLLDFNGVIVDDEPLHFVSFREVLAEQGIRLDEEQYYADYMGMNDLAAFREALRRNGRDGGPEQIRPLMARKAERYAELARRELKIVPGVRDFVRAAAERARVGVVSGALRPEIDSGLERAGIADCVQTVVSPEDVPVTKPDPAGFRLALRRLAGRHGNGPWRAVVVEDSLPGLAAGRALGAGCLMVTTSYDAGRLAGADAVWDSFAGHQVAELEPLWREVVPR